MGSEVKRIFLGSLVVFSCGVGALVLAQNSPVPRIGKMDSVAKAWISSDAKSTTISVNGDVRLKLTDSGCACKGCYQAECEAAIIYEVDGNDIFLDLKNPREGSGADKKVMCDNCLPLVAEGVLTGLNPGQYVVHYRKSYTLEVN